MGSTCKSNQPVNENHPLARTWMLVVYKSFSKVELIQKKASITIGKDATVQCNMGCNSISCSIAFQKESKILFRDCIATEMACENMKLETDFLTDFSKLSKYKLDGHRLILTGNDSLKMEFIAQDWD
jgi:heat shock protein HslJ